jgi:bromodomain adjacent to zinc finger domain protein 1A
VEPVKNSKNSRRSKRALDSDEESEPEEKSRKTNDGSRRASRRSSIRTSRKNTPEPVERKRKSIKKEEHASDRRLSKRSLDSNFNMINLGKLIDEIIKHNESYPFNTAVSKADVPDYYEVIKHPMDFSKIKSKLNLGDYQTNEQMMKDIQLIFYNCDLYNLSNSEIYK